MEKNRTGNQLITWKPHITVAAIIERERRFLMVEEKCEGTIVLNQPAGHLEQNENLIDAVVRETLEETAWHIDPTDIVGIYQWTNTSNHQTFIRVCFTGLCLRHEPTRKLDQGILQALWMTHDELKQATHRHRSPMVIQCVDDYLSGRRYPLHLLSEILNH